MKRVVGVLIIVICIFITGCSSNHKDTVNELVKYKNNMLKNFSNYEYVVSYDTKRNNQDYTMVLNCKHDLVSKIGYCYLKDYYYDVEKYSDYGNKVYYYRNIHSDTDKSVWRSINRYFNNNINHWYNIIDSIDNIRLEKDNKHYTGIINDKMSIAILLKELNDKINIDTVKIDNSKAYTDVYLNDDGIIDRIETSFNENEKIKIEFTNFNSDFKLELPDFLK